MPSVLIRLLKNWKEGKPLVIFKAFDIISSYRRLEGFDDTDNTINDLVSSFLIPEVERQIVRNQGKKLNFTSRLKDFSEQRAKKIHTGSS